ncbi:MAG: DNA-protecting protein DprA [Caulobacteraceae bacterium]|nr:DNA-protecting protein DprA [Caulobacteraceae bacterium]
MSEGRGSSELTPEARLDWLRLARTEGVGPVTFGQLIRRFGRPGKALAALPELALRGGRAAAPRIPSRAEAERELDEGERLGGRLICAGEAAFPPLLAAIDPAPPLIWTLGRAELLQRPGVGVVGARIASAAGQRFARGLAKDVGEAGYLVVSGMARGVDGAAHEGALNTGTAAVLGGGIADIYPPEHAGLYARLAEQGCVISESPPRARAQARDFPRRNRLISGLSLAVVVVEAEMRSGSLITARLAGEQGREVLAVPGSPLDPRAKGTNDLIRQGAALCEGVDDVLRAIAAMSPLREPDAEPYDTDFAGYASDADLAALRDQVAALLSPTPVSRDDLVRLTGAPTPLVYAALMELSLAGRAELMAGGLVASS